MTDNLVRVRIRLQLTCFDVEAATGIPASQVDRALSDPAVLDSLSLRTVRKLSRLIDIDLATPTPHTQHQNSEHDIQEQQIRRAAFLIGQQRCHKLQLQQILDHDDHKLRSLLAELENRLNAVGHTIVETSGYIWAALNPNNEDPNSHKLLAAARIRSLGPSQKEARTLYNCITEDCDLSNLDLGAALNSAGVVESVHSTRSRTCSHVAEPPPQPPTEQQNQQIRSLMSVLPTRQLD